MAITWQLYVNVNSTKMELTAYHVLNKHKVTKTLSNFPWCKDTKFLAGESLCLHFCGVALRVFVSLCLIVLWLFIVDFVELKLLRFAQAQAEPPAPEACRRLTLRLSFASYSMEISRQTGSACWNYMECSLKVHEHAIAYT